MMHEGGKSDSPIVPEKPPNKAAEAAAEVVEGRRLTKGSLPKRNASRTLSRIDGQSALRRVRQAARRDRKQRLTALLHHVYDVERLRAAYMGLRREAAAGVDGKTWRRHIRYYGVPVNTESTRAFRWVVGRLWWQVLRRRSQNNRLSWKRMERYINRWFPPARVCHPYPLMRFGAMTQGRSRMR